MIVAESFANQLTAFDLLAEGTLANRRLWAELGDGAPGGIGVDADGAVWYAEVRNQRAVRVAEGGTVLDVIELDRGGFACALAGDDRRTLCVAAATWTTPEEIEQHIAKRTGRIYTTRVEVAGVGWP